MTDVVLEVRGLTKRFKKHTAVNDVTFNVRRGEIMGFLGPNGAGKTTVIHMITGLMKPDEGEVNICGINVQKDFERAIKNIGAVVETPHLYEYMTGKENIKLFAALYRNNDAQKVQEIIKLSGLENKLEQKVKDYSLGMKQRLGLAVALLSEPSLLILDEPTNGLDPASIRALRDFLKQYAHEKGCSILISSHILSEMQLLCDSVTIICDGTIRAVEDMENIKDQETLEDLFIEKTGGGNIL